MLPSFHISSDITRFFTVASSNLYEFGSKLWHAANNVLNFGFQVKGDLLGRLPLFFFVSLIGIQEVLGCSDTQEGIPGDL